MLTIPARLKARWEWLDAANKQGRLPVDGTAALAECAFRLGVSAGSRPEEAIVWLQRALRSDSANPKYAYHLALFCFVHGELDEAAHWLGHAHRLCPTSHRIWAHIALLQDELNLRYQDSEWEQDWLRRRAQAIAAAVRDGRDVLEAGLVSFRPPRARPAGHTDAAAGPPTPAPASNEIDPADELSAIKRILDPGRCRWSGVHDLLIEQLLEDQPGSRQREALAAALEAAVERLRRRRGGVAAFVILAVEWLVSGYAPAFPRRLSGKLAANGPAACLLESTLQLFEARPEDLPALLAAMLERGEIPPLLAAAVHQRRLLGPPWRLRSLPQDYRAATQGGGGGAPEELTSDQLATHLRVASAEIDLVLPKALAEPEVAPAAAEESPADRMAALLAQAGEIASMLDSWRTLLARLTPAPDGTWTEEALLEAHRIREGITQVPDTCRKATAECDRLPAVEAPELVRLIDTVKDTYQNLPQKLGPLRRMLKSVPELPAGKGMLPPGHGAAGEAAAASPPDQQSAAEVESLPPLAAAVRQVDEKVRLWFTRTYRTFEAYGPEQLNLEPIRALLLSVRAREADVLYRLGKREPARAGWLSLLGQDRLDARALRNLAVCDALDADSRRTLGWWKAYAEILYFRACRAGSVVFDAAERSHFHADFGGAYAPRWLLSDDQQSADAIEESALLSFLASPRRAQVFVDHWLLSHWSSRLAYRSPPIVLGIPRSANEQVREQGKDLMLRWARKLAPLLSSRTAADFAALARRHVEEAFVACRSARRLTHKHDPAYASEHASLLEWTSAVVAFKRRVFTVLSRCPTLSQSLESLDALGQLTRIDAIPIDTGNEMARVAARAQRLPESWDPSKLLGLAAQQIVVLPSLRFVFPEYATIDEAAESARQRQYSRIAKDWIRHRLMTAETRGVFDDPSRLQGFYPPDVVAAFASGAGEEAAGRAATTLARLEERYPASSGIARHRAGFLCRLGKIPEARAALRAATTRAVVAAGRRECEALLAEMGA